MNDENEKNWVPMRFDFVMHGVKLNEETRIMTSELRPHPDRYVEVTKDGVVYFKDIYLNHLIPKDEMYESYSRQAAGLPIYHLAPSIDSTSEYSQVRKGDLQKEFRGEGYIEPGEKAKKHSRLEMSESPKLLSFISIDICNSTALKQKDSASFEKAYSYLLRELGTLVGQFNGTILKTTGDGFIAYIDHPSFTRQSDNIIDLGISIIVITRDTLNPVFKDNGLPELTLRVGADFGPAELRKVSIQSTGFETPEVSSTALNKAVKLEQHAREGEFLIGWGLYQTAHVQWLKRATEIDFDSNVLGDAGYKVFTIN